MSGVFLDIHVYVTRNNDFQQNLERKVMDALVDMMYTIDTHILKSDFFAL